MALLPEPANDKPAAQVSTLTPAPASAQTTSLPCPRCGQPARWVADNPARPFCSERCKLIDLGA